MKIAPFQLLMYSRNLFVLDFARRFFVNCAQISEAYVDEIRVQLAENRPQRQVQERLREYIKTHGRIFLCIFYCIIKYFLCNILSKMLFSDNINRFFTLLLISRILLYYSGLNHHPLCFPVTSRQCKQLLCAVLIRCHFIFLYNL